jgi:hypothetical protein
MKNRCRYGTWSAAALISLGVVAWPERATADDVFFAVLNSQQEIQSPKPTSNAFGNALMTFTNSDSMLCYSISYSTLVGSETAAHFHAPASVGENADVLLDISPPPDGPSPLGSPKTGCVGPLSNRERNDLRRGLFYINIHSSSFTSGEIRGQVLPVSRVRQKTGETVADTD